MARGWGKSEEDVEAEKEQARLASKTVDRPARADVAEAVRRHGIELSLARIEDQLSRIENPDRRFALESARAELQQKLEAKPPAKARD
ncbi:MAG: hypothetical protein ABI609_00800 [Acidobacteriota bacterium]